jgi:hypothetical protein
MQIDLGSTKNAKNPNNRNPQTLTLKTPKSNQEKNTRARGRGRLTFLGRRRSSACGLETAAARRSATRTRSLGRMQNGVPPAATSMAARSPSGERARRRGSRGSAAAFPGSDHRRCRRRPLLAREKERGGEARMR